ncbi:MAG: hypothetical protein J7647_11030 [Cyanobacteria bacterium SBLK]|nr:hypothetical protein [Cyanobacteria bacterium SBLK]
MSLEKWIWVPNKSFGIIEFNSSIDLYREKLGVVLDEDDNDDITGWLSYKVSNEEIYLNVENGLVVSIFTYEKLYYKREKRYKSKNIIGMTKEKLIKLFGREPDEIGSSVIYEDGDIQTPLDFDSFSLQVWISKDIVVSASCSNYL